MVGTVTIIESNTFEHCSVIVRYFHDIVPLDPHNIPELEGGQEWPSPSSRPGKESARGRGWGSPHLLFSSGPASNPAPPGCSVMTDKVGLPRASQAVLGQGSGCECPIPQVHAEGASVGGGKVNIGTWAAPQGSLEQRRGSLARLKAACKLSGRQGPGPGH